MGICFTRGEVGMTDKQRRYINDLLFDTNCYNMISMKEASDIIKYIIKIKEKRKNGK